jgi:hypothetical protein
MDMLNLLWTATSFVLGVVWSLVWFVLRDLISTLLWLLIAVWLVLSVRYRSFSAGSIAMLRYGRYGLMVFWRWLRGRPPAMPAPAPVRLDKLQKARARRRIPFGYMSMSEQFNLLLLAALYLLFHG